MGVEYIADDATNNGYKNNRTQSNIEKIVKIEVTVSKNSNIITEE